MPDAGPMKEVCRQLAEATRSAPKPEVKPLVSVGIDEVAKMMGAARMAVTLMDVAPSGGVGDGRG